MFLQEARDTMGLVLFSSFHEILVMPHHIQMIYLILDPSPLRGCVKIIHFKFTVAAVLVISTFWRFLLKVSVGQTIDVQKGAALFNRACIGCHYAGGNIIQPGATLFLKDLQRNGVDTEEEIYRVTYYGKGRMPGFGPNCTPRGQCTFGPRLQDDEIKLLAKFVKSQADQGWPKIENSGD
ncbi:hypothetical protein RND71_012103 [Anisodus tanguticus]|uniref:Cytochrome c-553 n=1 Tax=Anisodus tanguticus TaxID=243964 RepID=A0AAE1SEM4_9SOLA|nr:hypothetical protein RND71_012103 [Anisodus tanguticus]